MWFHILYALSAFVPFVVPGKRAIYAELIVSMFFHRTFVFFLGDWNVAILPEYLVILDVKFLNILLAKKLLELNVPTDEHILFLDRVRLVRIILFENPAFVEVYHFIAFDIFRLDGGVYVLRQLSYPAGREAAFSV